MLNSKHDKIFWFLFLAFGVLYFFVKFEGAHITEDLYRSERFEILNVLARSSNEQSLDFYRGKIEENLWGPLNELISGLLLMGFALRYLCNSTAKFFWLAIFLYLLITKFEVLFFPFYGDAIGGPFAEAFWLQGHNFDYVGLFHQEDFTMGGPKVYLTSLFPTYLAVLMKLIPSAKLFLLTNHTIVFAMGAAVIALFRSMLLKALSKEIAVLASMLLLSLPLFQSQVEAINMEMPSVFFAMVSLLYIMRKDLGKAAAFAILAVLIKETAIIICAAVFIIGAALFFFDTEKRFNKKFLWGAIAAMLFVVAKISLKYLMHDQHTRDERISFLVGWPSLRWSIILALFVFSLVVFLLYGLKKSAFKSGIGKFMGSLLSEHYPFFVMFISANMWFALFLNFFAVSPRYRLLLAPFLIFCFIYALHMMLFKKEKILHNMLVVFLAVSFFSTYGLFYAPLEENDHVLLERSLEYRNDLKLNMKLAKELEARFSSLTIGAPFIIAQLLAFPQLGYVKKDLDVMIYGMKCNYGDIKNFNGLKELDIARTIWVGFKARLADELAPLVNFPFNARDKIIKEIAVGDKRAVLFVGGFAIEKMRIMLQLAQEQAALTGSFR